MFPCVPAFTLPAQLAWICPLMWPRSDSKRPKIQSFRIRGGPLSVRYTPGVLCDSYSVRPWRHNYAQAGDTWRQQTWRTAAAAVSERTRGHIFLNNVQTWGKKSPIQVTWSWSLVQSRTLESSDLQAHVSLLTHADKTLSDMLKPEIPLCYGVSSQHHFEQILSSSFLLRSKTHQSIAWHFKMERRSYAQVRGCWEY